MHFIICTPHSCMHSNDLQQIKASFQLNEKQFLIKMEIAYAYFIVDRSSVAFAFYYMGIGHV